MTFQQLQQAMGARLRLVRESRGYRMSIAENIRNKYNVKIDASYLSRMERGKTEIPLRTLHALLDFYEMPFPSFFAGCYNLYRKDRQIRHEKLRVRAIAVHIEELILNHLESTKSRIAQNPTPDSDNRSDVNRFSQLISNVVCLLFTAVKSIEAGYDRKSSRSIPTTHGETSDQSHQEVDSL